MTGSQVSGPGNNETAHHEGGLIAERLSPDERSTFVEIGDTLSRETQDRPQDPGTDADKQESNPGRGSDNVDLAANDDTQAGPAGEESGGQENDPGSEEEPPSEAPASETEDRLESAIDAVEAVIDGLPEAIVVHREGALLHLNPYAATLLGLDTASDPYEGKTMRSLFGVYADDLMEPGEEPVTFTSAPFESGSTRLTARAANLPWPDGDAVQISLRPADEVPHRQAGAGDLPENVVRLVRDEVSAEAGPPGQPTPSDLLAMLNTATDGIMTLDDAGRVIALNASAEAMFGHDSEEVAGRPLAGFLTRESRDTVERYMRSVSDTGIASVLNDGREVTGIEKNGDEIPLFLTLGRLDAAKGEEDEKQRFCAVVRDMTSWKKTEAELIEAREAAELASAQKSEFLANISHEIRTPLNAILGFSEVMKARRFGAIENDKYSGYVNDIHSSGEHLLSLINDLLDLSKVEAGKLELNFASVDLGEVISQAISVLSESATSARVIVRSSVQDGLPNVVADQRSMRQIMLNLLSNAIKFTGAGGQVVISARLESAGHVSLKIKDTGHGMSDEQIQRAMEPFRQVEEVASGDSPGTGLGLPLTKALAEANRAGFAISSEREVGTMVEITFPTTRVLAD